MADRRQLETTSSRQLNIIRFGALGAFLIVLVTLWVSLHGAAAWRGDPAPASHPIALLADLVKGRTPWTLEASVIAATILLPLFLLALVLIRVVARRRGRRMRPDRAAGLLATRRDLQPFSAAGARATGDRLGIPAEAMPGVPIGKALPWKTWLYSPWEYMIVVVAGPRTMKSTAYAIPTIMSAPGGVLATSNKRDVVDATRGPRSEVGDVWVFDPQGVANAPVEWWWNPLTYIAPHDPRTGLAQRDRTTGWVAADEAKAEKLAGQLCASAIKTGAKTDAYFDGEAENLIGLMLLAAACADEQITTVYSWLATPSDQTAVDHLRANGFELQAQSLYALANVAPKQRDGVYGTALARMGFLRQRRMAAWVTDPAKRSGGRAMRQFHPVEFAASTDTLYPLSKEGAGSAGPLVAALTVAVIDALGERATANGGRLPVPFVAVLDEAANICRFRDLDSYYSFFGSQGIIIETILQNWAQGEEVWGVKGMEKLWSAANVKVYGGGVDDDKFLRRISDLIGTHTHISRSESVSTGRMGSRGNVSVSTSMQERTILTIGELRELPQGRAVAFISGTPATLIEPQPWFRGDQAAVIEASLKAHAPSLTESVPPSSASRDAGSPTVAPVTVSPWNVKPIREVSAE
jgi:type IV secretory pathway TraG/TraD family ATPase VirD4